jgi:hypothetical protein
LHLHSGDWASIYNEALHRFIGEPNGLQLFDVNQAIAATYGRSLILTYVIVG